MTALSSSSTLATIVLALTATATLAQVGQQVESICGKILDNGVRDNYYLYTETELYTLYKSRLCDLKSENYQSFSSSAGSLGLSIPIADAIVGFDADSKQDSAVFRSKYSAFCASSYAQSDYKTRFQINQSQASASLANAWASCTKDYYATWLANNSKGITISATPQDGYGEVTVFVRRKSSIATNWRITSVAPSSVQCSYKGAPLVVDKTSIKENELQLSCTKNPNTQAVISIGSSTDGVSNEVAMPAIASRIAELLQRNNELALSIEGLRQQLIGLNSNLTGVNGNIVGARQSLQSIYKSSSGNTIRADYNATATDQKICAPGSVLVGFSADGRNPGGLIGGITGHCEHLIR